VREIYQQNLGGTDRTWEKKMAELCGQLMEYVNIKKDTSLLYPLGTLSAILGLLSLVTIATCG